MSVETLSTTPWYKQFWPWFIIALPATVVVAGISMVFVAFKHADSMVIDNYYKDGMAINQTLEQDVRAVELGLEARLNFDSLSGEVLVAVSGNLQGSAELELMLIHPVDGKADRLIALIPLGEGRYRADLDSPPQSRFYLRLQPRNGDWRLNGELDFRIAQQVTLTPDV